ncbi:hypothetical protein SAMN06265360_13715 [Haloechinothrix alba]|uniref:Uncharacterized protein n=1 Tax=Haloechinothrix alba TaxID=664784 RepID=A0A239AE70_9PSEU|nr:hypothetical protein SAMN06265360_13715 [Haloechinothrix alba]
MDAVNVSSWNLKASDPRGSGGSNPPASAPVTIDATGR